MGAGCVPGQEAHGRPLYLYADTAEESEGIPIPGNHNLFLVRERMRTRTFTACPNRKRADSRFRRTGNHDRRAVLGPHLCVAAFRRVCPFGDEIKIYADAGNLGFTLNLKRLAR